jgi:hypothetical protein
MRRLYIYSEHYSPGMRLSAEGERMRRVLIISLLFILLAAACAPAAAPTEEPSEAEDQPTSSPESAPIGPVEESVIKQLAEHLGLKESEISLVSSEETEFSDACLGVTTEGVMCAQVITPGRIIVLEANGAQYEYHTSEDGSRVQPASLALVWKREGGIVGFCDILTVFRSGEVYANKCTSEADGSMGSLATLLTTKEQQQFGKWMTEFGETRLDASDPKGVSDRMVVTLELFGSGSEEPTETEKQALFEFAQNLYQELTK